MRPFTPDEHLELAVQELENGLGQLTVLACLAHDAVVPQAHVQEARLELGRVVAGLPAHICTHMHTYAHICTRTHGQ